MKQISLLVIVCFLLTIKFIFNSPRISNDEIAFFSNYGQLFALVLGAIFMVLIIYFFDFLENEILVFLFFSINIILLIAIGINLIGAEEYGSIRRIYLSDSFSIQPSELLKFPMVLISAILFKRLYDKQFTLLSILLVLYIVPILLIQLQPNTSTALLFSSFFTITIFLCGSSYKTLLTMVVGFLALLPMALTLFVAEYQFDRINAFTNPSADPLGISYIPNLVEKAVVSSGFIGSGFIEKTDSFLFNVLAADSDFALAVLIEQLGLIVLVIIIASFFAILWIGTTVALNSSNRFEFLCTILSTYIIVLQAALHIMVNLSLLPSTGTTLPFISNGSNSLVVNLSLIGIIIGTEQKNQKRKQIRRF